jgi:hypothetical protein
VVTPVPYPGRVRLTMSRRRARRLAAAALAVAVLPTAALAAGNASAPLPGSWRTLAPAPIAPDGGLASVWAGNQMLLFGTRRQATVAAAYRPGANRWRRLPSGGPAGTFPPYHAVWTGSEMLVWGQGLKKGYSPRTNRWRNLPDSPLLSVHQGFGLVVWTGREMIGWGGGCCGDAFSDGVAYSPATNRWRALPRSPLAGAQHPLGAWTGRELVIFVGNLDPDLKPWPARFARAAAYNPATNSWRRIPRLPQERGGANVVWDGHEVLVVGGATAPRNGKPGRLATVGFGLNPTTNRWRRLASMESGRVGAVAAWSGRQLLLWGGQTEPLDPRRTVVPPHGLAYDPTRDSWSPLPQAPMLGRVEPTSVWTGRALIVWGGDAFSCNSARKCTTRHFQDGAAFRPD